MQMKTILVRNLGKLSYIKALQTQESLWALRDNGNFRDTLLLVEHVPEVYSLGRRESSSDILINKEQLQQKGIKVHHVGRGGNVTWHGPGQLVAYPILYLGNYQKNVRWFFTAMQRTIQMTLENFGIKSGVYCEPSLAGVWVGPQNTDKIAAIGVQLSRWYTMHGFALNVNPDLSAFSNIIPCGITDAKYSVTSMAKVLNRDISIEEVIPHLVANFGTLFGAHMIEEIT